MSETAGSGQRSVRDALGPVLRALSHQFDLDPVELADVLWLWQSAARTGPAAATDESQSAPAPAADQREPDAESAEPASAPPQEADERLPVYPDFGPPSSARALAVFPFRVRERLSPLPLMQALRPLKRRWPVGQRQTLDLPATVRSYAATEVVVPAFRPAPERWFSLDLVLDASMSALWSDRADNFAAALEHLGAFGSIRRWTLDDQGRIFPEWIPRKADPDARLVRPVHESALRASNGRRLVVIISDCMDHRWYTREPWLLLRRLAANTPTALVNPIPTTEWPHTALDFPTTRLVANAPGSPPAAAAPGWVALPIPALTPHALGRWAQALMSAAPDGCDGALLPRTGRRREAVQPRSDHDARALVRSLKLRSPAGFRIATLAAAQDTDDINTSIFTTIVKVLVPTAGPADLAALASSVLVHSAGDVLRFRAGVRAELQQYLTPTDEWNRWRAVSESLAAAGPAGAARVAFRVPAADGDLVLPAVRPIGEVLAAAFSPFTPGVQAPGPVRAGAPRTDRQPAGGQPSQPSTPGSALSDPTAARRTRVFLSYAHESARHRTAVRQLRDVLATLGFDVAFDGDVEETAASLASWMDTEIDRADFMLVVASPRYRQWAREDDPGNRGYGIGWSVLAEARKLRSLIWTDIAGQSQRVLGVVLPGARAEDLPWFLLGETHYLIAELSPQGLGNLARALRREIPPAGPYGAGDEEAPLRRLRDLAGRLDPADPDNSEVQHALATTARRLGETALASGNVDTARDRFREGLPAMLRLMQADPADVGLAQEVSRTYERLADLARDPQDRVEASRWLGQAVEIRRRLAEADPANADLARELAATSARLRELTNTVTVPAPPRTGYVFISYSRQDTDYVRRLTSFLDAARVPTWNDSDIEHGDRWYRKIKEGIDGCSAFVVIQTPSASKSAFVEQEVLHAQRLKKPILPLLLRGRRLLLVMNTQDEDVTGGHLPSREFVGRLRELIGAAAPDPAPVRVDAWGSNIHGQSGVPHGLSDVVQVAGGQGHSLALHHDGHVTSWGGGDAVRLGSHNGLRDVTAVAAGFGYSLALHRDGRVTAWGNNDAGRATVPLGLTDAVSIAAGSAHSIASHADGRVSVWGRNDHGQAVVPEGLSDIVTVAAGGGHSLALDRNGRVTAWGRNDDGQSSVPPGLEDVIAVAAGFAHSLALRSDGTVTAWGRDHDGQASAPRRLTGVVAVAAGYAHSLVLHRDGHVTAWGSDNDGQTTVPSRLGHVIAIAAGSNHSLAISVGG